MIKQIEVPLFGWELFFCNTRNETLAFLSIHGDTETTVANDSGLSHRIVDNDGTAWRIMAVFENDPAIIAHEAVHTAWGMLNRAGISVTFSNDESLAYLAGWLAREFTLFMGHGDTNEA